MIAGSRQAFALATLTAIRRASSLYETVSIENDNDATTTGLLLAWTPGIVIHVGRVGVELQNLLRDTILIFLAFVSLVLTPVEHREANGFTWEPIREVATLFAGIFVCIVPVLAMLDAGSRGPFAWMLALTAKGDQANGLVYFWLSGILSSVLDNAPTYLRFFEFRWRRPAKTDGPISRHPGGYLAGGEHHGSTHVHRQRPELIDLRHGG